MTETDFIDVPIGTSRILAVILITMHAAAIVASSVLPIPLWLRVAADVLLLASAALIIRRYAFLKGSQACSRLRIYKDGECRLALAADSVATGQLQSGWLASPLLVVARVRCNGERLARKIVLLPDSTDADTLRRLRIFLRFALARSAREK
jgi:toxin CptA